MTTLAASSLERCGREVDSRRYWADNAAGYVAALAGDYHAHRLHVIDALIPRELYCPGRHIFDFGCGDAVHFNAFLQAGAYVAGVDVASEMIAQAQRRLTSQGHPPNLVREGDVTQLRKLADQSLDALLSFNVLAYLTDDEERVFYQEARRIVKPGGWLIVTHSNELFDLYSLNAYTRSFIERHLQTGAGTDSVAALLKAADQPAERVSYNVRENPLAYRYKLATYGFHEERQEFINLHRVPPPLMPANRDYPDTLAVPEHERWKLIFVCSTFGSRAVRKG